MKNKLILIILIAVIFLLIKPLLVQFWQDFQASERDYNRRQCAVYGYYEDCKTPLPDELRLK